MAFHKATKYASFLRLALFGPSGAGKTYTALRIARGMELKAALIDTEYGSASKYGDRFDFETDTMEEDQSIAALIAKMEEAKQGGFQVLIIDSGTHSWKELLEEVDQLAKAKYGGNTWSAWSEGTPKQKALINAILSYPGHVIVTFRSKTEWVAETNSRGKTEPRRIGLAPEAGKGIEYEFDMLMEVSLEHIGRISKDRTGKFQDKIIPKPDEKFGHALLAWLRDAPINPVEILYQKLKKLAEENREKLSEVQLGWIEGVLAGRNEAHLQKAIDRVTGFLAGNGNGANGSNGNGKAPEGGETKAPAAGAPPAAPAQPVPAQPQAEAPAAGIPGPLTAHPELAEREGGPTGTPDEPEPPAPAPKNGNGKAGGNGKGKPLSEARRKALADLNETAAHALITDEERQTIQGQVAECASDMMLAVLAERWGKTLAERQGWTGGDAPAGDPPPAEGEPAGPGMSAEEAAALGRQWAEEGGKPATATEEQLRTVRKFSEAVRKEADALRKDLPDDGEPEYDSTAIAEMAAEERGAAKDGAPVPAGATDDGELDLF
jgi:hypothetical protein